MKKTISNEKNTKETRPEYDFSGGIRGKYARALKENGYTIRIYHDDGTFSEKSVLGEKTVVLDEDVWEYFPTSEAVNQTLRTLIEIVPQKARGNTSISKAS